MNFGIVSESERASIMAILNANNFSTTYRVKSIDGTSGMHLEAESSYMCHTTFLTREQYLLLFEGVSIKDRIERFKFFGENFAKLPPCLPPGMHSDEQSNENKTQEDRGTRSTQDDEHTDETKRQEDEGTNRPWSITLHPSNQIWKKANFNIFGFLHYVH